MLLSDGNILVEGLDQSLASQSTNSFSFEEDNISEYSTALTEKIDNQSFVMDDSSIDGEQYVQFQTVVH